MYIITSPLNVTLAPSVKVVVVVAPVGLVIATLETNVHGGAMALTAANVIVQEVGVPPPIVIFPVKSLPTTDPFGVDPQEEIVGVALDVMIGPPETVNPVVIVDGFVLPLIAVIVPFA